MTPLPKVPSRRQLANAVALVGELSTIYEAIVTATAPDMVKR